MFLRHNTVMCLNIQSINFKDYFQGVQLCVFSGVARICDKVARCGELL